MLHRKKLFLLSLLGAIGVAAATASTALAVEETPHFIKGGKEITEELKAKGTITSFYIRVPTGLDFYVLCEGVENKATIGPKWKSKLTIEFTKCTMYNLKGEVYPTCTVKEPIVFELNDQLVYKGGKKGEEIYDIFYGAGQAFTRVFGEVDFMGTCAFAGEQAVLGSAIALPTPKKSGEEAETYKVKFMGETALKGTYYNREKSKEEKAGEMSFFKEAAYLEGEVKLELESKEKFGIE